jgi:hypothetical protein
MNRIKREGIIALVVLAVMGLSSCEKDALSGRGRKVAVNFTLGALSYGEEETVVRSAGRMRMEPETVVAPVEGALHLYVTLEEEKAAPLRALETITPGARVRIVAYDSSNAYVGDAEYEVGSSGELVGATALSVSAGNGYRFVAYSLNTTAALSYAATMGPYSPDGDDVLWGISDPANITEGGANNVTVKMYHQFSRVRFEVTCADLGAYSISALTAAVAGYKAGLTVQSGLTKDVAEDQAFVSYSGLGTATVTGARRVVYTGGEPTTEVKITSATVGGTTRTGLVARFNRKLEPGKSYTLKVSFKEVVFAYSNIYWDDVAQQLTFDTTAKGNQGYQGVMFKWGSLVGVSPALSGGDINYNDNTVLYVPYGYPSAPKWKERMRTEIAADGDIPYGSNWTTWGHSTANATDIPYLDQINYAESQSNYGSSNTYAINPDRNTEAMYQSLRGDICQYLSKTGAVLGNYRLPIANECGTDANNPWNNSNPTTVPVNGGWVKGTGTFTATANAGYPNGRADLLSNKQSDSFDNTKNSNATGTIYGSATNIMMFVTLPAAGNRYYQGELVDVGSFGDYWSGSLNHNNIPYEILFNNGAMAPLAAGGINRSAGVSVRCIKI